MCVLSVVQRAQAHAAQQTYKEAKQSRNRPDVAQRVPGGLDSQIIMTFGT